jgi:hypothetical protein
MSGDVPAVDEKLASVVQVGTRLRCRGRTRLVIENEALPGAQTLLLRHVETNTTVYAWVAPSQVMLAVVS